MLTCFQIADTENKDGINILNGADHVGRVCKEAPFKTHRPSAFRYDNSTVTLGCGWDSTSLGLRMSASLVTVAIAVVSAYLTVIRKSKLTYIFAALIFLFAVGFGWLTYNDSSSISASSEWCDGNLTGTKFAVKPKAITCDYGRFIFVAVLDAFSAVCWVGLAVFTVLVKRNLPDFLTKSADSTGKKKKQIKKPLIEVAAEEGANGPENSDYVFPESPADDNDGGGANDFGESAGKKKKKDKKGKKDKMGGSDDGAVDFDEQSSKRFPPMSKTTAKQLAEDPKSSSSGKARDGDFDFSQMDSGADSGSRNGGSYQQQQKPAPPPPSSSSSSSFSTTTSQAQPKPAPAKSNDYFDFESLELVN